MLIEYYICLYIFQNKLQQMSGWLKAILTFILNNFILAYASTTQGFCLFAHLIIFSRCQVCAHGH